MMFVFMMIVVNIAIFYGFLCLYKGMNTYINSDYYIYKALAMFSIATLSAMLYLVGKQHRDFDEIKKYHQKTDVIMLDTQEQIKDLSFSTNYY